MRNMDVPFWVQELDSTNPEQRVPLMTIRSGEIKISLKAVGETIRKAVKGGSLMTGTRVITVKIGVA